ncbi:helix-turn-helix domain-containing protein [Fructobacillus papyrifericola]|uniref:Helix-turn-helix transcriptional regulator n=1 Tax=Fructobacillus papyrifericola TaxID=2713172 RepID=A0ABS5QUS8_9LACO|nr:helix-turn-helix transcriptional regulator [Fructobacillus papyrifericola]MBS9336572.1 helix-turn-helix transcriptional regulator [Fructobacillus papyrifericola]
MVQNSFLEVQRLGELVRRVRKNRGISAQDLALETNLSASAISKFERGQSDIQLSTTVLILGAMGITINDLCQKNIFLDFRVVELAEKANRYQHDAVVLARILKELQQMKPSLRHERIFMKILLVKLNSEKNLSEIIDYFEDLDELLDFDRHLYSLVKPFLPKWALNHLAKRGQGT